MINLSTDIIRKLSELGYNRSAKKCKEKFENVYKYHKRTREGRTTKGQGKTYRFFDQLEAFENNHPSFSSPTPKPTQAPAAPEPVSVAMPAGNPPYNINTVPLTTTHNVVTIQGATIRSFPSTNPTNLLPPQGGTNPTNFSSQSTKPSSFHNIPADQLSNSTSSSTSSDLELEGRRKSKRKWKDFFERLMKEVIEKQEELQKKFLEAIEKREHERMVREEAWRMQEMTRIDREREILAQERSISASKDAAVMAFLQKLADQQQNPGQAQNNNIIPNPISQTPPPPPPPPLSQPLPAPPPPQPTPQPAVSSSQQMMNMETMKTDNGGSRFNNSTTSSSRWPKAEVQALIKLRTNLDSKYQENGPKGPLWEEISAGMRKLGYNRSAKRCKEKWENINKYFKKVKESNKRRPEDSKTCPYFHQLDALYKEKNKFDHHSSTNNQLFKPENTVPLMVRPEQQWPPQPQQGDSAMEDVESEHNVEEEEEEKEVEDDEEDGGERGGEFAIVPNKQVNSVDATNE